jgi:hypothetical protein
LIFGTGAIGDIVVAHSISDTVVGTYAAGTLRSGSSLRVNAGTVLTYTLQGLDDDPFAAVFDSINPNSSLNLGYTGTWKAIQPYTVGDSNSFPGVTDLVRRKTIWVRIA